MYIDIRRLRDAVRRQRPEMGRTNSWFLPHYNAPAHRSVLVTDFLSKNNVTTLEHPPYSPDLAPGDFYVFPPLKSVLKGRRFYGVTDIIKNATEELKRFHTVASRNVSNTTKVAGRSVCLRQERVLK
jgi:transposase